MSQESEQKQLPASSLKLKKQREKGRIAKSADMYSAVAGVVGLSLLMILVEYEYGQIYRIFDAAAQGATFEWGDGLRYAIPKMFNEFLLLIAPVIVAISFGVIIANLIYNKGIPFSFDPLKPRFERLNPVEGFKRVFGRRGMIDGAQKIVRLILWLCTAVIIIWTLQVSLINAPICGYSCTADVGATLIFRLVVAAIVILLIIALLDMPIQNALFLHEMKMGKSEQKRENKDQYGAPEIRSERKRLHKEILNSATRSGLEQATFIITGETNVIAIRYIAEQEGVPYVVAKASAEKMEDFVAKATALNLPKIENDDLAKNLSAVTPGSNVPQEHFQDLALAMVKSGIVKK